MVAAAAAAGCARAPWRRCAAVPRREGTRVVARAGGGPRGGGSGSGGARRSPYVVLGVDPSADRKAVKQAFRKVALKVHPDVNPSPDAAARFQEAKDAYELLSDEQARRDYDARGYGNAAAGAAGRGAGGPTPARPQARAQAPPEDFYSLGDFWRDVTGDLERLDEKKRRGGAGSGAGVPLSLWEELAALGEELVEFLEDSAPDGKAKGQADAPSPGAGAKRATGRAAGAAPPHTTARKPAFDVDAELEKMKRDMGLS